MRNMRKEIGSNINLATRSCSCESKAELHVSATPFHKPLNNLHTAPLSSSHQGAQESYGITLFHKAFHSTNLAVVRSKTQSQVNINIQTVPLGNLTTQNPDAKYKIDEKIPDKPYIITANFGSRSSSQNSPKPRCQTKLRRKAASRTIYHKSKSWFTIFFSKFS